MSNPATPLSGVQLYKRLLNYTLPYKWVFMISILGMIITAATQPALASLMKPLMDGGFIEKNPEVIRGLPPLIVGLFLLQGLGQFSGQYAMGWIGRKVIFDIRNDLFNHLMQLPTPYYDNNASGILISKVIYDVEQIAQAATKALFVWVKDSLTIVGLLGWMFYQNWKLTLVFVVAAPALAGFVRFMSKRFRKTSRGVQKSMGGISNVTQESIEGHRIVKAFGAHEYESEHFREANERNRRQATRKAAVAAASVPVPQIIASFLMSAVLYYALKLSEEGSLTPGEFISYFAAMGMMMNPAKRLTKVNEIIQQGIAAAESVFLVLDEKTEEDTGTIELDHVTGEVVFSHVGFTYPGSERPALKDLSFVVKPGQKIALVGMSGSGKTTTANLLPRFYNYDTGSITLDGRELKDLTLKNLRKHISLVSQETILFNDSIRNNIAYGIAETVDEDKMLAAARAAHVAEFVENLPEGYDTLVGEKGVRLSGGQRQRIAIARALYKNAPVLILDEATSSLDTESERFVQDAMEKLMSNRTTLIIAHRLSTIEKADRILVLEHGSLVESGSHQELMEQQGIYAGLHSAHLADGEL